MANFFVTTDQDVIDPNDGVRSLREIIIDANATPEADTIFFTFANQEFFPIRLNSTLLITEDLTINGSGATRIEASDGSRVFDFTGGGTFDVSGVDLTGSTITQGGGGAIRVIGDLVLEDVTISGASTTAAGAHGGAVNVTGDLDITDSVFLNNQTTGSAAFGGAVYASGSVTAAGSDFEGNSTTGSSSTGGALYAISGVALTGTDFVDNSTSGFGAPGGAVYSQTTLTVSGGAFSGNQTTGNGSGGGAGFAGGEATLTNVSATNNSTGIEGGTGATSAGGAFFIGGAASISGSTFSGNQTFGDQSGGGAIRAAGALTATSTTFTANATQGDESPGGAISATSVSAAASLFDNNTTSGERSSGGAINAETDLAIATSELVNNSTAGELALGGAAAGGIVRVTNATNQTPDATPDDPTDDPAPIRGNATSGVGANGGAIAASVSLEVANSDFDANLTSGANASGGALFSAGVADVSSAVISGNTTGGQNAPGGGLAAAGDVTVAEATFRANETASIGSDGGGISSQGAVTLTGSNIEGNATAGPNAEGGGVSAVGTLIALDTTVTGNSTAGENSPGGGLSTEGDLVLNAATVSANSTEGLNAEGGGAAAGGNATLANATLAANATEGSGSQGGGLYADGDITVFKSTVTGNLTEGSGAEGGGIFHSGVAIFGDTIVLGNAATGTESGNDLASTNDATPEIRGAAILGDGTETAEDVFAQTVELADGITAGVLADNGGQVATVALLAQSSNPALDAGLTNLLSENAQEIDLNGDGDTLDLFSTDARGEDFTRSFDIPDLGNDGQNFGDLGAVEANDANRVPVLEPISQTLTEEDAPVSFDVLTGLVDPDGDVLTLEGLGDTSALLGTASFDAEAGTVTYDLGDAFQFLAVSEARLETVTYLISDGNGTATGTIDLTVTGENDAPVAEDDSRSVLAGDAPQAFDLVAASVTDPDTSDTLTVTEVTALSIVEADRSELGTLTIDDDGQGVTYDPGTAFNDLAAGETRTLQASYTVEDPTGASDTAVLEITVTGQDLPNTDPVAVADEVSLAADAGATTVDVLANDSDPDGDTVVITAVGALTSADTMASDLGSLALSEDGLSLAYDPGTAFDSLLLGETVTLSADYTIGDGNGGTATAAVEITVTGVAEANGAPEAEDDTATGESGASILVDILANDSDPDGDDLTVEIVEGPASSAGRAVLTEDGQLVFRAAPDFVGTTTVTYAVSDGRGEDISPAASDTAEVAITVTAAEPNGQGITLGEAQQVAYLYEVGLNRDGNIDSPGVSFWIDQYASGLTNEQLAQAFINSDEYQALEAAYIAENGLEGDDLQGTDLVDFLYDNALGRPGDDFGRGFWTGVLLDPSFSEADLLFAFSTSTENIGALPVVTDLQEVEPGVWDIVTG